MKLRNQKCDGLRLGLFAIVFAVSMVALSSGLFAQPGPNAAPAVGPKTVLSDSVPATLRLRKEMLFADVTAQFANGRKLTGYLLDLEGDTLTIIGGGGKHRLPLSSLSGIRVEKQANAVPAGVYGMVIGGYLVDWAVYKDPAGTGFMRSDFTEYAYVPLLVAFGVGGLCYALGSAILPNEREFTFSGDSAYVVQEKERFLELVTPGEPRSSERARLHILLTGGSIGYPKPAAGSGGYGYGYPPPDVTFYRVVRRIQATYSILSGLQAGGAILWLDEPASWAYGNYQYVSDANGYSSSSTSFSRTFTGNAYLAIATAVPLQSILPEEIGWQVGGGLGVGKIDYRHVTFVQQNSYSTTEGYQSSQVTTEEKVQGTKFAATIFTQVDLFLYRELSVGLAFDYTFMPGTRIPAVPELGLGSRLAGNTCIGLGIGLHF